MTEADPVLISLEPLRHAPEPDPAALARLRSALVTESVQPRRRRLILSPIAALAAATTVALVTSVFWLFMLHPAPPAASTGADARTAVQFVFVATQARSVSLVGDFNDWDARATPMIRSGDGVWSVEVRLEPGRFNYAFLVDGLEWRADPAAVPARGDFGRPSSVLFVNDREAET